MDEIDKKILNLLQKDDKISYQAMSEELKMAASTIHNRVKRMKERGIIKQFSAIIDSQKVGYQTTAWLGLSVDPRRMKEIAEKIASYENVQVVAISSGDHDLVAQVISKDDKELWKFINSKIKTIEGVSTQMDVSGFIDVYKHSNNIQFKVNNQV